MAGSRATVVLAACLLLLALVPPLAAAFDQPYYVELFRRIVDRQRRPATQPTVVEFNGPGNNGSDIRNGVAYDITAATQTSSH